MSRVQTHLCTPPPSTPTIRIGVEYRSKDANGRSSALLHLAESITMNTYRITHKLKLELFYILFKHSLCCMNSFTRYFIPDTHFEFTNTLSICGVNTTIAL